MMRNPFLFKKDKTLNEKEIKVRSNNHNGLFSIFKQIGSTYSYQD